LFSLPTIESELKNNFKSAYRAYWIFCSDICE
jgi:hypothetical protein